MRLSSIPAWAVELAIRAGEWILHGGRRRSRAEIEARRRERDEQLARKHGKVRHIKPALPRDD